MASRSSSTALPLLLLLALAAALSTTTTAFLLHAPTAAPRRATTVMAEQREGGAMQRRHALGQAMGKLALIAGAGSWAAGLGPFSAGGVLPAHAETTAVKKVSASKVRETPNGVKYVDVVKGEGESPKPGDFCIISYTGYLPDGTIFDGLHAKGKKPLAFKIGARQVIPGLEEALLSMKAGGERQILVPAELAYGEKGVCLPESKECLVPPNSPVKYDLILKRVAVSPI